MSDINMGEMFFTAIKNAIIIIWPIFRPYVYVSIAVAIFSIIIYKLVHSLSMVAGYSPREAKKRAEKAKGLIDLLSAFQDIFKK